MWVKARVEVVSCTPPVSQGCWQSSGTTRLATLPQLPWAWAIDLTAQPDADCSEHATAMTMLTCPFASRLQILVLAAAIACESGCLSPRWLAIVCCSSAPHHHRVAGRG